LAHRIPLASYAPITEDYRYPGMNSGAVVAPIGAQDTNQSSEDSGNELSILNSDHLQIPNWYPARSKVNLNENRSY
jgi:hypothetical protein